MQDSFLPAQLARSASRPGARPPAPRWLACLLATLAAASAQASDLTPAQQAVLKKHGDYPSLLKVELDFRRALGEHDLKWLQNTATDFRQNDLPVLQEAEALRDANFAFAMGACHEASVVLHQGILAVARRGLPRRVPAQADEVVPLEIREQFVDHMRRCELIKRQPRTERKIGAGLGW